MADRRPVVIDLDGTILDVRERHFAAHQIAANAVGLRSLEPKLYWRRKRAATPTARLFGVLPNGSIVESYDAAFLGAIESPSLLTLDRPHPGASRWLRAANGAMCVVIATARNDVDLAIRQVLDLKLSHDEIVVCGRTSKSEAVMAHTRVPPLAWVGDTEADITAAAEVGARCTTVANGLRSRRVLLERGAEAVVRTLSSIQIASFASAPTSADRTDTIVRAASFVGANSE